jgi:type I restriction enzyme S subunit
MAQSLQDYSNRRETGHPWIKNCPSHWSFRRMKYLFEERVEKGYPNEPLLTASQSHGVIEKKDYGSRTVEAQKDLHLLKLVEPGDYVISLRSFQGGIEFAHKRGIISPAYTILKPGQEVQRGYYEPYFKCTPFVASMTLFVTGIREGQNIDYVRLSRAYMPVPPAEEQVQIGRFVRQLDSRVNRLIKAKRRLIELLHEQASVITLHGRGKSIFEREGLLLSRIPASWECLPAKRIFEEIKVTNHPDEQLLAATQDRGVLPKSMCEQNYVSPSGDLSGLKLVLPDDFVISLRSFQGGIEHSAFRGLVSPAYNIIRLRSEYRTKEYTQYFRFLLKSPRFISLLNTVISGIRDGKNILFSDFGELVLPVPTADEVKAMMPEFSRLDDVKQQFFLERKLVEEYRTRLIADVVTGQLDVRQHPWANTEIAELENAETEFDDEEIAEDSEEPEEVEGGG